MPGREDSAYSPTSTRGSPSPGSRGRPRRAPPLSALVYRLLRLRAAGNIDLAVWALLAWLLGSREGEAARKAGLVLAAALAAASLLELALTG